MDRQKDTVYANPEFWVYVHDYDAPSMYGMSERLTPDQAATMLRRRAETRRVSPDMPSYVTVARATWQIRDELDAMTTRTKPVVWSEAKWWRDNEAIWAAHGVRPSTTMPGLLAYYQSADKACRGILTPIKAGRYLGKFFSGVLVEKERARMARWFETGSLETCYDDAAAYPLAYATNPEDIASVYEHGPDSCMSGAASGFDDCDGYHPAEVYGAGDLAIAYLTNCTNGVSDDAKVCARAVVWPARKVFGRVYPTAERYSADGFVSHEDAQTMQNALRNRLLAEGYENGSIKGAKLLKTKLGNDGYLMPYLDGSYGVDDIGEHFIVTDSHRADYQANSTNGYIEAEEEEGDRPSCDRCEDRMDDYEQNTVYTRVGPHGGRGEVTWCNDCCEHHTFFCQGFDETFSDDVDSVDVGGSTYTVAYANENFPKSDLSDDYFDGSSVDVDGETWSQDEFDEHGFICAISDENYHVKFRHPDYPEIHCDTEADDIAAWLEETKIEDARQMELAA